MANVKISALPTLTSLAAVDLVPVYDTDGSPVSKSVTALKLAQYIATSAQLVVPPVEPPDTFEVPLSVDNTGGTDMTSELLAYFATVPDGNTITFPDDSIYLCDFTLLLQNRHDLTFEGNGVQTICTSGSGSRERRHWHFKSCSNIILRDIIVHGANPNAGIGDAAYVVDKEAQHGFDFDGCEDCLVERCEVYDIYGDFFYVGVHLCKRITFQDNIGDRNGRQGFGCTWAEDIVFQRNTINNVRRSVFDVEPTVNYYAVRRVLIDDNDIGPFRLNFVASKGASSTCEDITISNNSLGVGAPLKIDMNAPSGGVRRGPVTITGNTSVSEFGSALENIRVVRYDGVTIANNTIVCQPGRTPPQVPIGLYYCTAYSITGNTVTGSSAPPFITP